MWPDNDANRSPELLQSILGGLSVPNFMAIHAVVETTFYSKLQMWSPWWQQRKCQGIIKVIRIHPLGTMMSVQKCCANPSCRCRDISLDKWKFWHAGGARFKVRAWSKSSEFIMTNCTNFHGNSSNLTKNQKCQFHGGAKVSHQSFILWALWIYI